MSDTPEAPEPPAPDEVVIDLAAFLPEGTILAADDAESPASRPPVDVAVLERVESELADVDAALVAIDAGEPGRSPLLVELLGEDPTGGP